MTDQTLSGVPETLLLPLYMRALESQRPDALLVDEQAVKLVQENAFDFERIKHAPHDEESQVAVILRSREFDRCVCEFCAHNLDPVVVYIGCGLDGRFERVDDGRVLWFDLDLPEVIALRRKYIGAESERHQFLAYSVFDPTWLARMEPYRARPVLFLAEGVLMYFSGEQVQALVQMLREHFPGAELVCDAFSPFFVWANNRRVARTQFGARCNWAIKHGTDLESWGEGIRLLAEWFPFRSSEPRLKHIAWARNIPLLAKTMGVYHYQLGGKAV